MAETNSPVIVRLLGGMGNQLFQYAMGRALADAKGVELVLDPRFITRKAHISGLAIELFNIRARFLDTSEYQDYPEWRWKLSRVLRKWIRPSFGFYHEVGFTFDEQLSSQIRGKRSDTMLSGFWQSHQYFPVADVLRQDLSLRQAFNTAQQTYAVAMQACNSVALHVRRGDYLNNPKALAKHGVCSLEYYQQAVNEINARIDNPVFYVFSDDPEWVRQNIAVDNAVFVSDEGFDQEIDLMLIASCQHQIIANSSFSWWGAYLNPNSDKVVVAPTPWFDADISDADMSPPQWLKLTK